MVFPTHFLSTVLSIFLAFKRSFLAFPLLVKKVDLRVLQCLLRKHIWKTQHTQEWGEAGALSVLKQSRRTHKEFSCKTSSFPVVLQQVALIAFTFIHPPLQSLCKVIFKHYSNWGEWRLPPKCKAVLCPSYFNSPWFIRKKRRKRSLGGRSMPVIRNCSSFQLSMFKEGA